MTIDFDRLQPLAAATTSEPPADAVQVPSEVLERFNGSARAIGHALKREGMAFTARTFGGEVVATGERTAKGNKRTKRVGGTIYLVPVK